MNIFQEMYGTPFEDFEGNLNEGHMNVAYEKGRSDIIKALRCYTSDLGDVRDREGNYVTDEIDKIIRTVVNRYT